jgi:hypothetical protein
VLNWQLDAEGGAAARGLFDLYSTLVQSNDFLHDGKPKTGSTGVSVS